MSRQVIPQSLLANPAQIPLRSVDAIASGATLVVAPHPDDECLGCGGAIALLRQLNNVVNVVVVSDGTGSHPNSRRYPAPALRALREQESRAALSRLGVMLNQVTFLGLKDGAVPTRISPDFDAALTQIKTYLKTLSPQTVFLPWRRDPHADHRATWELFTAAMTQMKVSIRQIEYLIWDWDPAQRGDAPLPSDLTPWRLDISSVVDLKQQAIAQYRSQITNLIDDDPEGFCLTPEMIAHFAHPWELYLETHYGPS